MRNAAIVTFDESIRSELETKMIKLGYKLFDHVTVSATQRSMKLSYGFDDTNTVVLLHRNKITGEVDQLERLIRNILEKPLHLSAEERDIIEYVQRVILSGYKKSRYSFNDIGNVIRNYIK